MDYNEFPGRYIEHVINYQTFTQLYCADIPAERCRILDITEKNCCIIFLMNKIGPLKNV